MHAQDAEHLAPALAARADGGGVGGDRRVVQRADPLDIAGHELIPAGRAQALPEPGRVRHRQADDVRIPAGAPIGDHASARIADPEVEIDRVGVQDHAQSLAGVAARGDAIVGQAGHDGRVRGPPPHVAGALVEISVDDLDGVQGEIRQALTAQMTQDRPADGREFVQIGANLAFQRRGDRVDLGRDLLELLGDDGETLARLARARRHDQGVDRQHLGRPVHPSDLADLGPRHARQSVGKVQDPFRTKTDV